MMQGAKPASLFILPWVFNCEVGHVSVRVRACACLLQESENRAENAGLVVQISGTILLL